MTWRSIVTTIEAFNSLTDAHIWAWSEDIFGEIYMTLDDFDKPYVFMLELLNFKVQLRVTPGYYLLFPTNDLRGKPFNRIFLTRRKLLRMLQEISHNQP